MTSCSCPCHKEDYFCEQYCAGPIEALQSRIERLENEVQDWKAKAEWNGLAFDRALQYEKALKEIAAPNSGYLNCKRIADKALSEGGGE